jgi:MFS family permease
MSADEPASVPSLWRPLRIPILRSLLLADIASDVGTFMQTVGAAWLMVSFGAGPMYVALTQTASALPFFLFALPAGAVGDIVDRRRLVIVTELWMIGVAAALAAVTLAGRMTPWLLLAFTFALSAGDAFEAPTWRAIFPELVPREDLEATAALNGIEFNIARAVGPSLAGLVISAAGVGPAFVVNTLSFVGVLVVVVRWKRPPRARPGPAETLKGATVAALRYVRYSPPIRTVLVRGGAAMLFASGFLALLPTVAREAKGGAAAYGVLLGTFGFGAVAGALAIQPVRGRFSTEVLVSFGSGLLGLAVLLAAGTRVLGLLALAALAGGAAWIVVISLLSALVQTLVPDWVRARVMAVWILVFQGGIAAGSALWGALAERRGTSVALAASGAGLLLTLLLRARRRLPQAPPDTTVWENHWRIPAIPAGRESDSDEGPVLVVVEYDVSPESEAAFLDAIHKFQLVRRRDGAGRWGVYYDLETPGRHVETFLVSSWAEHLRQHARFTRADQALESRVRGLVIGAPRVKHYLYAHRRPRAVR